jgi:hypothetical protein
VKFRILLDGTLWLELSIKEEQNFDPIEALIKKTAPS